MLKFSLKNRHSWRLDSKLNSIKFGSLNSQFSSSSLPAIPSKPATESTLVAKLPFRSKSKGQRKNFNASGSNPQGGPFDSAREKQAKTSHFSDSPVNLYAIYGNILAKEPQLLHRLSQQDPVTAVSYPLDDALLQLFQSASRICYESGQVDARSPTAIVIEGPTRKATWEIAQLVSFTGKSHLAIIPFSLFYELYHRYMTVFKQQTEAVKKAAAFGSQDFGTILNKSLIKSIPLKQDLHLPVATNQNNQQQSRAVLHIVEYLFACSEASLGSPDAVNERFTLFIDGLEDFLATRRGGDVVLRDLLTWAQDTGRHLIFGTRSLPIVHAKSEEAKPEEPSPQESSPSPPPPSSKQNFAQFIAEIILKPDGQQGQAAQNQAIEKSAVNVRLESGALRLHLAPPACDRHRRLLYSQLQSRDRLSDILDSNLIQLRTLATNRWKSTVKLSGLPSKHSHPSDQVHLRELFLSAGRGVLGKRRLCRDELNEILILALGEGAELNELSIAQAVNQTASLRHDPSRLSADDLNHLLAERHVTPSALNKYERRFLNCIATATTQTFFKDVAVPIETVNGLRALTSLPLSHPELFTQGVLKHSMTGVLLFGPPGTGKTMLARAVAQESGATFLAVNMSNIFDMWVGEGEKNVKGMFTLARKLAPCIIFIDEIDALLEKRSSVSGRTSRLEIVNEFMSQWDGLASNLNAGVIVMGATNRPFVLDDAVLRRLPRRLLIDLPIEAERLQILRNLIAENAVEAELEARLPDLARRCQFYSGSDLKNVAITAGLKAAMRSAASENSNHLVLTLSDFEAAIREVPASLSDQMDSLQELRRWNAMYGEAKEQWKPQKFGFA